MTELEIVGVLLGLVVLASVMGFHVGPHAHVVAATLGIAAAVWLIVLAATGQSSALLWALLSADIVISAGVAVAAWTGLSARHIRSLPSGDASLSSAEGVALDTLNPKGQVRVRGETWSATSLNGPIAQGATVQVIRVDGVRLEVWGEETAPQDIQS